MVVNETQLSLAIGKRGQNVRLAARLTGWDIDILTPTEYSKGLDDLEKAMRTIEGVDDKFIDRLVALGIIDLRDLQEVGFEPLVKELELTEDLANKVIDVGREAGKRVEEEDKSRKAAEAAAAKQESTDVAADATTDDPGSENEDHNNVSVESTGEDAPQAAVNAGTADPEASAVGASDSSSAESAPSA